MTTALDTRPDAGHAADLQGMEARADEATAFLKALAHEGRLRILCALVEGEKSTKKLSRNRKTRDSEKRKTKIHSTTGAVYSDCRSCGQHFLKLPRRSNNWSWWHNHFKGGACQAVFKK